LKEVVAEDGIEELLGGAGAIELPGTSEVAEAEAGSPTGVSVPAVVITPGAVVPTAGA